MNAAITSNLDKLNRAMALYVRASGRGVDAALQKQASELGRNLAKTAKGLMPARGAITAERLAALKAGEGIRVRQAARDYAQAHTVATAMDLRTKGPSNFREKTRAGNVKSMGRNWWDIAVARELAIRESGRGFLSHSERLGVMTASQERAARRIEYSTSKYGPDLGEFAFSAEGSGSKAVFKWGGFSELSDEAVQAMGRARGQAAIAQAIQATIGNMVPYIERKLGEAATEAFR